MTDRTVTSSTVLIKNSLLNLTGMIIPLLVGVVAIPFAVKGLGTEGFGILSIAWVLLSYLALLDFGLSRATTKFAAESLHQNNHQAIPSIFWTASSISVGLGVLSGVVLWLVTPLLVESLLNIPTEHIEETKDAFRVIAVAMPFILLTISLKGMLAAAQRFDLVNGVLIPLNILNFIIPALSLWMALNIFHVMLLIVISRIVATAIYGLFTFRVYPECRTKREFQKPLLRRLISYGSWVTVTGVVSPLLVYLDRFFIGSLLTMNALTFYAAPLEAITRLRVLPQAVMTTLFPEFSAGDSGQTTDRIALLFGKSLKFILMTMGIMCLFLLFFGRDILHIWLGGDFAEKSTFIFQVFSMAVLINFLALVPFTFLQGIGRPDIPAKFHLAEIPVYLLILWPLIRSWGIEGAAVAWGIRVALDTTLLFAASIRFLPSPLQIFRENRIGMIGLVLTFFAISLWAIQRFIEPMSLTIVLSIIPLLFSGFFFWRWVVDDAEKLRLQNLFQKAQPVV